MDLFSSSNFIFIYILQNKYVPAWFILNIIVEMMWKQTFVQFVSIDKMILCNWLLMAGLFSLVYFFFYKTTLIVFLYINCRHEQWTIAWRKKRACPKQTASSKQSKASLLLITKLLRSWSCWWFLGISGGWSPPLNFL